MSTRCVCTMAGHAPPLVFNLRDTSMSDSVRDILERAAEHHHVECGCSLRIGGRVWISSVPLPDGEDYCDFTTMSSEPLPVNAVLEDLYPVSEQSTVYLVLSSERAPSVDYCHLYRQKIFASHRAGEARVLTRVGSQPLLPPETLDSFDTLCSMPGATFVDKSKTLHAALDLLSSSRVHIIRRPKGFGKTTFISMFDAFFDPLSAQAHFPFLAESRPLFPKRGGLLVFTLDLADLAFTPTMRTNELDAECARLLDDASKKFCARYHDLLCVPEDEMPSADFSPTFLHILGWTKRRGWCMCFTVDNYTAPLLDGPDWYYARSISQNIFARLFHPFLYGLIVGEDVPHASDLCFPRHFTDLSDEPELYDAMGFTLDEVIALGQAISADLISALPPGTPTGRYARRVYAAEDIIALARSLTSPDSHGHAPTNVRTIKFKHPPLPAVAVEPEHFEWDASDFARINDELVANLFGPLSDEEDDVDAR